MSARKKARRKRGARAKFSAGFACGGVGIIAKGRGIAFGKDFHHPAVKVIHRVVHDGLESTIVLAMSFLNVVFQSDAEIPVFAAQFNLFRS